MLWSASAPLLPAPKSPSSAEIWTTLPPAPATPQLTPYAEKKPSSLTAPQLLAPMLAPFTCLYTFTPVHHIPGAFAFGTPACSGSFSLHPQSCILPVCASKIKWVNRSLQDSKHRLMEMISQSVQKHLQSYWKKIRGVLVYTDTENYCCSRGAESSRW